MQALARLYTCMSLCKFSGGKRKERGGGEVVFTTPMQLEEKRCISSDETDIRIIMRHDSFPCTALVHMQFMY